MPEIADWVRQKQLHHSKVLDFGCGKGGTMQWLQTIYPNIHMQGWDIGTEQYRKRPRDIQFDGIYSIDCWEHIEESELLDAWANLDRISHADTLHCHIIDLTPAKKRLPDGRNAHVTLWSVAKWLAWFGTHSTIQHHAMIEEPDKRFGRRQRLCVHLEMNR